MPTSVAPSGLAFLTSDRYASLPAWKGSLFMGTLRGQALIAPGKKNLTGRQDEGLMTGARKRHVTDVSQLRTSTRIGSKVPCIDPERIEPVTGRLEPAAEQHSPVLQQRDRGLLIGSVAQCVGLIGARSE